MSKTIRYKLTFHGYWHCGSGLGAGAKADALVVKDADGLPYVPGRTVKGLVREAVATLVALGRADEAGLARTFGQEGDASASGLPLQGSAFFSDAALPGEERKEILSHSAADMLYSLMASTSIDETGVAKDHTLRSVEVTVPCELTGRITGLTDSSAGAVGQALRLIRRLGLGRSRGLGRCSFAIVSVEDEADARADGVEETCPDSVQLVCQLTTDVILNQKSASEGANKTLDFIPGSCFLGIAAASLYSDAAGNVSPSAFTVFHSGKVRFGDAHPLCESPEPTRSLRIPASLFYPKGDDVTSRCFVHHHYSRSADKENNGEPLQLKQCRAGFYAFSPSGEARRVSTTTAYALKSAHDSATLRSKDSQMFGYESLRPGARMGFSVEFDPDVSQDVRRQVVASLLGAKRVGRSRSAQYGQVEIRRGRFAAPSSGDGLTSIRPSDCGGEDVKESISALTLYADSRLIFLSDNGLPTFQPAPAMLGLPECARIRYDMSQVRTFQYSPWNAKRQCFDTDRCGIEKGSVLVIEIDNCDVPRSLPPVVGCYRAEGFGHVIWNPTFLESVDGSNGLSSLTFVSERRTAAGGAVSPAIWRGQSPLLRHLERKSEAATREAKAYKAVNDFVENNEQLFRNRLFASQWGTVRSIAASCNGGESLIDALFADRKGYLAHGVAKDKWCERGRGKLLREFIESNGVAATVNLASEMAKKCRDLNS